MYKYFEDLFFDKILWWYTIGCGLITCLCLIISTHLCFIMNDKDKLIQETISRCIMLEQQKLKVEEQMESAKVIIQKLLEERQYNHRNTKPDQDT